MALGAYIGGMWGEGVWGGVTVPSQGTEAAGG